MNRIFIRLLVVASLTGVQAQGTFEFIVNLSGADEVPPNSSPFTASGSLSLDGNVLRYLIGRAGWDFLPSSAGIYGPATSGQNGSLIFDMGNYGLSPNPPTLQYGGAFTLTSQQISEVKAGSWYVNLNSTAFPDREIRGQITPVPEPSTWVLVFLGGVSFCWCCRCKAI